MIFIENITEKDLIGMNIKKMGHRKCILKQIKLYKMKQIEKKHMQNRKRNHNSIAETLHISNAFHKNNINEIHNQLTHSQSAKSLHFNNNKSLGSLELYYNIKNNNKILNNHRSSTESIYGSNSSNNKPIQKHNRRYRTRRYNNKLNRSLSSFTYNNNGSESDEELYESSPSPQSMPINMKHTLQ